MKLCIFAIRRPRRYLLSAACIFFFILLVNWQSPASNRAASSSTPQNDKPKLDVVLKLTSRGTTYQPLDPLRAVVKLTNSSDQTVYIKDYNNKAMNFVFEVDDVSGPVPRRTPNTFYYERQVDRLRKSSQYNNIVLKPGESAQTFITVNLMSDMTAPTTYSIVVGVPTWISPDRDPDQRQISKSSPIKVEIKADNSGPNG